MRLPHVLIIISTSRQPAAGLVERKEEFLILTDNGTLKVWLVVALTAE